MSDSLRIARMVTFTVVTGVIVISGCAAFGSYHSDQVSLAQLHKEAAQARAAESKALAERAMFEQMKEQAIKSQAQKQ